MNKTLWVIDPVHSEISFKVRHMMITNVTGTFDNFTAKMHSSEKDFSDAEIDFEAQIDSVNTRNEQRDGHLKSDDFFSAGTYPTVTFVNGKLKSKGDHKYDLMGDITIKGVTKPITLACEFTGTVIDPWGQAKAGFEINAVINRSEFGLTWNASNEDGDVVLAEEVKLALNIQMIKQM